MRYDFLIVGAGISGCTVAERLASEKGVRVLLVDRRGHIGGNCYDQRDEHGIIVQRYGPHVFHTNDETVWRYLTRFTSFNDYVHRVLSMVRGRELPVPICLETIERLYDRKMTEQDLRAFFEERRVVVDEIRNSRDVVVSQVGEEIYDLFFKNYTRKQWGVWPEELDPQVTGRIPVRYDRDTRYFTDAYQGIPSEGFTRMFERMVGHENIEVVLETDYRDVRDSVDFDRLVYTGAIDEFFDRAHGPLPFRSLAFRYETLETRWFQSAAVINHPNEHDYTRITEFKHFYGQDHPKTTVCYEYPRAQGDPYYPIPRSDNKEVYDLYRREAAKLESVYFVGRLAEYRYYNMDQAVAAALDLADRIMSE